MKRWQIVLGIVLIVMGLFAIIELIFDINFWRFLGPLLLIGLGVLLILRPQFAGPDVEVRMPILGEVRRTGVWEVTQHEIWWLVGSTRLDFTDAVFPKGEAVIKIYGFVTDNKITLPDDVGFQLESTAFVSERKGPEGSEERFVSPLFYQSSNYEETEKRVRVQTVGFVSEIRIKPSLM
jgi:predicted membrane protein